MFWPRSRGTSVPAYFTVFRAAASLSRCSSSRAVKSISLRKLRLRRLYMRVLERRVALDGAAHAVRSPPAAAELGSGDRDHLNARLAQAGVGVDVAVIGDDDAGLEAQEVVAVIPLLPLGTERVTAGRDHPDLVHAQRLLQGVDDAA